MNLPSAGLLPVSLAWFGCYGLCRELAARNRIAAGWRVSWMLACLAWATVLTLIVELTSLAHRVDAPTLFVAWIIAAGSLCGGSAWLAGRRGRLSPTMIGSMLDCAARDWKQNWPLDARLMLLASGALIIVLGVIAVGTPTTNWDSMTYHLPRVMHWIEQHSVEHFPTNNTCQIEYGPWSEYAILTFHLLGGGDQLDNIVQWFAMLTCVIASSYIAEQLISSTGVGTESDPSRCGASARRRAAALAGLLVTTLPIGVVESITTQTDYVVTCWVAVLMSCLLALWREGKNLCYAVAGGLALALGILTKATMFVYAAVPGVAYGLWWLFGLRDARLRANQALIFALALVVINAPHWARNYAVFGSPLGSRHVDVVQRNKGISVSGALSNVVRNLTLQTNTGIRPLTDALNALLLRLHRITGRDLQDPDFTSQSGGFGVPDRFLVFDSYASNFYHLMLALLAVMLLFRRPHRHVPLSRPTQEGSTRSEAPAPFASREGAGVRSWPGGASKWRTKLAMLVYLATIVAGFVLFCAMLRWQQWHGRIHIAWLVLLMPLTGAVLAEQAARAVSCVCAAWVWAFAVFCLLNNASRPILDRNFNRLPREQQYMQTMAPTYYEPLTQVAAAIVASRCNRVGVKFGYDDPEYVLWVLLGNRGFKGRIDHFYVENETALIRSTAPSPCVVVTTFSTLPPSVSQAAVETNRYGPFTVVRFEPARPKSGQ